MVSAVKSRAEAEISTRYPDHGVAVSWTFPPSVTQGDLATPAALQLAKALRRDPLEIATELATAFAGIPGVAKAHVAAPGYVNLWMTPDALLSEMRATERACVPRESRETDAPVIVEYSQPNIAKPLGVHHLMGTVLGQATANLEEHAGARVIRWNYLGDWGTQFGKLAVAYDRWGKGKEVRSCTLAELLNLYVRFHEALDSDPTLEDAGREAFRQLEAGDPKLRAFWQDVVAVTKASLAKIYDRLHVHFDLDLGESFYEEKMQAVLEEGKRKGVFTVGEGGALIVRFPGEKYPPYLVLKGDGATLYSTRDLAQMRYRMDTYHPSKILIFTDIAQKLHFEQLVETCRMLGWELPVFENVLFGRMRFADASMSTRKGNILHLEQVLDEGVKRAAAIIRDRGEAIQTDDPDALAEMMGVGALVYGILSQNRKQDIVFDWEKMLSFEGNSAPYLQYTHARARSVLRKSGAEDAVLPSARVPDHLSLGERRVIAVLLRFPAALEEARAAYMPHVLATYLYALAQEFNAFYNAEPILKAQESQRTLRLGLTHLVARVLRTGAELLTLRVPDRM